MMGIWGRRSDLTGVVLRASFAVYPPNAMLAPDGVTGTGYFPDLFHMLKEAMNFSLVYLSAPSGGVGRRQVGPPYHMYDHIIINAKL